MVACELEPVSKRALEALDEKDVILKFPPKIPNRNYKTVTVLKKPKTDSSVRKVWLPKTLAMILGSGKQSNKSIKISLVMNILIMI